MKPSQKLSEVCIELYATQKLIHLHRQCFKAFFLGKLVPGIHPPVNTIPTSFQQRIEPTHYIHLPLQDQVLLRHPMGF